MFKKKVKVLALCTVLIGSVSLVGCSGGKEEKKDDPFKVTLVLDAGGVNDQSFNQSAWEGAQKAQKELGIEAKYLESKQESDYDSNIETAIDEDSDLIIGIGFKLVNAIEKSAKAYPDQQFAIVDGVFENEIPSNVTPILFNEEQSGYTVGLVAGKMTESNKIGFVGGMEIPSVTNFLVGFEKGIKEVNPEAKVVSQYANSFTDSAKGKAIANKMYSDGADIVFTAGGGVNSGIYESAKELGKKAIGVDMPQNYISPETIITSALKNVGTGVELTIKDAMNGELKGGTVKMFDLSNDGVGFEKTDLIPQDVVDFVNGKIAEMKQK